MKDKLFFVLGILVVIFGAIFLLRLFSGEDNWICKDGVWVKHGQPSGPAPVGTCQEGEQAFPQKESEELGVANPASQYCIDQGGRWERYQETAGEVGLCYFSDGSVCEEWKFFRGECKRGVSKTPDTSHSYRGKITPGEGGHSFVDESGVVYQLGLQDGVGDSVRERLLTEAKQGASVVIVATEVPPLSKILLLKSFLEK